MHDLVTLLCTHTRTHQGLDPVTPTVDCGAPQFTCDNYSNINYSSTLEGSTLQFSCMEGYLPSATTLDTNELFCPVQVITVPSRLLVMFIIVMVDTNGSTPGEETRENVKLVESTIIGRTNTF